MKLDYEVNISTAKILRRYGLGEDKAAQRFLAEDVERKCQPYVPRQSGILEETLISLKALDLAISPFQDPLELSRVAKVRESVLPLKYL